MLQRHSETENVNARKMQALGNQQPSTLLLRRIVYNDMMKCVVKVQRLSGNRVASSEAKSGANMKRPIEQRFSAKVVICESGCHEWAGYIARNGYGNFHKNGKTEYAHRVAYEIANGQIGDNYVLHTCDNRKCVNPDHLFVGTFYDNMDDMVAKGRQAHGEKNSHAKLTREKVLQIRQAVGLQREIAAKYGVTRSLVSMIRSGKIWKNV